MLPFLSARKKTATMMASSSPDGSIDMEGPENEPNHALLAAAEDLISAVNMKDAAKVAEALQAAHEICSCASNDEASELFESEEA